MTPRGGGGFIPPACRPLPGSLPPACRLLCCLLLASSFRPLPSVLFLPVRCLFFLLYPFHPVIIYPPAPPAARLLPSGLFLPDPRRLSWFPFGFSRQKEGRPAPWCAGLPFRLPSRRWRSGFIVLLPSGWLPV